MTVCGRCQDAPATQWVHIPDENMVYALCVPNCLSYVQEQCQQLGWTCDLIIESTDVFSLTGKEVS